MKAMPAQAASSTRTTVIALMASSSPPAESSRWPNAHRRPATLCISATISPAEISSVLENTTIMTITMLC
ncbi:hypothetical protein L602_000400000370 [Cupriavidus gilardii J11]|uniref:Uncharacterized protein n=1 Tax=Cupriavidus gilardii J11 TaxID=936133 RepID=A0A562B9M4_9BURK|nr:hypothetical protein L602_000400000370 [Cupriavidus gilardii J11]